MKIYYVYRHIRLDKNEPFYIGIGIKDTREYKNPGERTLYSRAYSKKYRSSFWKNIINKTNYTIEIIYESNSETDIKSKESEFIRMYGRKDLNSGCLCNLTNGEDGCYNLSEYSKEKMRIHRIGVSPGNKGIKVSKDLIEQIKTTRKRNGIPNSLKQRQTTSRLFKGRKLSENHLINLKKSVSKEIKIIMLDKFIIFSSISDCLRFLYNRDLTGKEIIKFTYHINKAITAESKFMGYKITKN